MRGHGQVAAIGAEGIGSFSATLTRALTRAGERVVEVNRPNRLARRLDGKPGRLHAKQIAWAILGQTSTANPRARSLWLSRGHRAWSRGREAVAPGGRELLQAGPVKSATLKADQDRVALRL